MPRLAFLAAALLAGIQASTPGNVNQTITAVVTSVIQTSAGRMIFAEPSGAETRRPSRVKPREESA